MAPFARARPVHRIRGARTRHAQGSEGHADVDLATGQVRFLDAAGKLVLAEAGQPALSATSGDGKPCVAVSQRGAGCRVYCIAAQRPAARRRPSFGVAGQRCRAGQALRVRTGRRHGRRHRRLSPPEREGGDDAQIGVWLLPVAPALRQGEGGRGRRSQAQDPAGQYHAPKALLGTTTGAAIASTRPASSIRPR